MIRLFNEVEKATTNAESWEEEYKWSLCLLATTLVGKTCRNWANNLDVKSCRMFSLYENLYVRVVKIILNGL